MRITRINCTLIAAAVCASLTMGLTGGVASAHAPTRTAAVQVEHLAARAADTGNAELIAKLGDTLSIGAKVTQEAQAENPDSAKLEDLRRGLEEAARQLASVLDQAGAVSPDVIDPAAQHPAAPQVGGDGGQSAADAVTEVRNALDQLVADVTDLLAKVVAKDLGAVTAGVARVVADLQALLLAVPKLLADALPLPIPVPLPLNDQGQQPGFEEPLSPEAPLSPEVPLSPAEQQVP